MELPQLTRAGYISVKLPQLQDYGKGKLLSKSLCDPVVLSHAMQNSCLAAVSAIDRPSKVQAGKKIYDNKSNLPDLSIPKQCLPSSSVTKEIMVLFTTLLQQNPT